MLKIGENVENRSVSHVHENKCISVNCNDNDDCYVDPSEQILVTEKELTRK